MNIANTLCNSAARHPHRPAVFHATGRRSGGRSLYSSITFSRLNALCDAYASELVDRGVVRGARTLVMVRPGVDFTALVFALFRLGAVPVLIDPGMGLRGFLRCVRTVEPEVFCGIHLAQALRHVCRRTFASVNVSFSLDAATRQRMLHRLDEPSAPPVEPVDPDPDDLAGILFTTGSTGPAKGVEYTVRTFQTQVDILRDVFAIGPEDVDLPCFPLFGLFSVALGATVVIPHMDPTRPADVNPRAIIEPIRDLGVNYSFGSPALWRTVSAACVREGVRLESLRKVFMAGAPVPAWLHRRMLEQILPSHAEIYTPYGATESLPIAAIGGREMLSETAERTDAGAGICVGRPVEQADVRIICVEDEAIEAWDDGLEVPRGKVGEITVTGPMVTARYYALPEKTRLAKIDHDGAVRHRVGDLGYFDEDGRLWVCGRKNHRVETERGTLYSVCCEAIVNRHPRVYRSALVGLGQAPRQLPVLIVEPEPGHFPRTAAERRAFQREIAELANSAEVTRGISAFLFHRRFPTDIRHNSKIRREDLREWAAKQSVR